MAIDGITQELLQDVRTPTDHKYCDTSVDNATTGCYTSLPLLITLQ